MLDFFLNNPSLKTVPCPSLFLIISIGTRGDSWLGVRVIMVVPVFWWIFSVR